MMICALFLTLAALAPPVDAPPTSAPVRQEEEETPADRAARLERAGRFAEALPLREQLLADCQAELGSEHEETAFAWNSLGADQFLLGRFERAAESWERSAEILERLEGLESPHRATALVNLSAARLALGRSEEAAAAAETAVAIFEATRGEEHVDTADARMKLAQALFLLDDVEGARDAAEWGYESTVAALGEDELATADAAEVLAAILAQSGSVERAFPLSELVLRVREEQLGPEHVFTVRARNNFAARLVDAARYEEALPLLERVYEDQRRAAGPDHPDTITSRENLGWILNQLGRSAQALELLDESLASFEQRLGPKHARTVKCRANLAMALAQTGERELALEQFQVAYEHTLELYGATHPSTTLIALNWSATAYELGDLETASELLGVVARGQDARWNRLGARASSSELSGMVGEMYLRVARQLAIARRLESAETERAAYASVLAWKSAAARVLGTASAPGLSAVEAELSGELQAARSGLAEAVLGGVSDEERLALLRARRERLERELRVALGTRKVPAAAGPSELALAMPADAVAVDLFANADYLTDAELGSDGGRWTDERLTAWVTRPGAAPVRIELGPTEETRAAAAAFVAALAATAPGVRGLGVSASGPAESAARAGRELRELVWAPLAAAIGEARTVVLSPDEFLAAVPFHALQAADGRYLIEERAIVLLHDLASLPELLAGASAGQAEGALLVGEVDYDRRASDDEPATEGRWKPLPATARELEGIGALAAAADTPVELLRATEATEERLVAALPGRRFVHLATHGFFRAGEAGHEEALHRRRVSGELVLEADELERARASLPGLATGLVCAGANQERAPGRADGLLTAEEVAGLDLGGCELVVLSACETALGTARGGEAMASLQRAFRLAGARTVVASMWAVDDAATAELMGAFYDALWSRAQPPSEALRQAQLDMLARQRQRHGADLPWTWAAFTLSGDWRG